MKTYTWNELTEAEKHEAGFRGFPRGAGIRYLVRNYKDGELMLERWVRA
jgi:hypothetical protein